MSAGGRDVEVFFAVGRGDVGLLQEGMAMFAVRGEVEAASCRRRVVTAVGWDQDVSPVMGRS